MPPTTRTPNADTTTPAGSAKRGEALRVGVLMSSDLAYFRQIIHGVAAFTAQSHGLSALLITPGADSQPNLSQWRLDGLIGLLNDSRRRRFNLPPELPVINVSAREQIPGVPLVTTDNVAIGRMAADHLISLGFEHLVYVGYHDHWYSQQRLEGFAQRAAEAGIEPVILHQPNPPGWHDLIAWLAGWLKSLPRPAAVACCNDLRARSVVEACRATGLRIPQDIAVIGVDNDEVFCTIADPPLSSIDVNGRDVGQQAARLMHAHLTAGKPLPALTLVEPIGVVSRQSSRRLAHDDPLVTAALEFIHHHAKRGIGVEDILDHLTVSRRSLERRFREVLGHTPAMEIRKTQVELAKRLLVDTRLSLPSVAAHAGLGSDRVMRMLFARQVGVSPSQYRERFEGSD